MKVHFIAIGGSAMHNLAIALHLKGAMISGSDDEIFEPSKGRLKRYGLLPIKEGWDEKNITLDLDAVILGMHARADNPELLKAQALGLKIFSYPEYLYEHSKNKKRIVIGGSHGKTTITAMILHVLNHYQVNCDYMVGAQLAGFDVMVKLSDDAPFMILEGDEYLTSPIDRRPKFHLYLPDTALLSGIAWDHINVFPTFENYVEQFKIFIDLISEDGSLIYCSQDEIVNQISLSCKNNIHKFPYSVPEHIVGNGITSVIYQGKKFPLEVFGKHNLMNLNGARLVCNQLGISDEHFFTAIQSFKGASKRLELVKQNKETSIFKDFAHSPSKLSATINAVKEQFPDRALVACIELHTFSSLSQQFLEQYKGCMDAADEGFVYYSPHALSLKKLPSLDKDKVKSAFGNEALKVFTDSSIMRSDLVKIKWQNKNLLMMSSGDFDGIDFDGLASEIIK